MDYECTWIDEDGLEVGTYDMVVPSYIGTVIDGFIVDAVINVTEDTATIIGHWDI